MNVHVEYESKSGAVRSEIVAAVGIAEVDADGTLRLLKSAEDRTELARYNDTSWLRWKEVP